MKSHVILCYKKTSLPLTEGANWAPSYDNHEDKVSLFLTIFLGKIILVLMGSENKLSSRRAGKHLKQCQTDLRFTSSRPPD